MNKIIVALSLILGVLLLGVSFLYFVLPASHLPHFIPGYSAALSRHHFTHGIASLFLALLAFAIAWFNGDKKSVKDEKRENTSKSDAVDSEGK